jgi:hypothetical protein
MVWKLTSNYQSKTILMKQLINRRMVAIFLLIVLSTSTLFSQPKFPQIISGDEDGFVSIFDGQSLQG